MSETRQAALPRIYLVAWVELLILTAVEASLVLYFKRFLPVPIVVIILIISALIKASLIGAYYMNLKFERLAMAYIALIPLLVGIVMFFGIVPDAARVLGLR